MPESHSEATMKMATIGRLAGGVAHDFNNLLTAIMGNVDLALRSLDPHHPAIGRLREIGAAAESAASLTRQLLALSRDQVIEPRIVDLNALVTRMGTLLRRLIGEDIALHLELDPDLPAVWGDPGQLEQVLLNLAVNARDAMPEGGRLLVKSASLRLEDQLGASRLAVLPGEYVTLAVEDTGQGMSDDVKRRIFEPYFTTKPHGRGTGLGLATIHGIVTQAGGQIEVDSALGRGTTFKVYLPSLAASPVHLERPHGELPRGAETVLVVEDDQVVRAVTCEILSRLGYSVIAAADGVEAQARLLQHQGGVDLILTDLILPGMNGRKFVELAKTTHAQVRVLFMSGYTEDVIARHGVLDPGVHFIAKPYTPRGLAEKMREVLESGNQTVRASSVHCSDAQAVGC